MLSQGTQPFSCKPLGREETSGKPQGLSRSQGPLTGSFCHCFSRSPTLWDFLAFSKPVGQKEMATHSSVLAWRIPGTAEPGGLPSTGSHRVGHNWSDLAAAAAASLWGRSRLTQKKWLLISGWSYIFVWNSKTFLNVVYLLKKSNVQWVFP